MWRGVHCMSCGLIPIKERGEGVSLLRGISHLIPLKAFPCLRTGYYVSLVPRPSLTAFFAAVAKTTLFATAAKKAVREGLGTRLVLCSDLLP